MLYLYRVLGGINNGRKPCRAGNVIRMESEMQIKPQNSNILKECHGGSVSQINEFLSVTFAVFLD